jgi:hypothetical protein
MPANAVYVGRPSPWGNPFVVGGNPSQFSIDLPDQCKNVETAIICFEYYAQKMLIISPHWLDPLRGKTLVCWCAPNKPCHADVLLRLANMIERARENKDA